MRIAPIFRRIVLVATGSGIASCTPAVLEQKMPIRLLWVAPGARETFGDKLVDSIVEANPEAIIYSKRSSPNCFRNLTHISLYQTQIDMDNLIWSS